MVVSLELLTCHGFDGEVWKTKNRPKKGPTKK
jgi:hypothetical protein